jgi:hypothetical protein
MARYLERTPVRFVTCSMPDYQSAARHEPTGANAGPGVLRAVGAGGVGAAEALTADVRTDDDGRSARR